MTPGDENYSDSSSSRPHPDPPPRPVAAQRRPSASTLPPSRWGRGIPSGWRPALREFAIIMGGVLAALGAQAWWESSQERERETDYLRQMLADTRSNEERLARAIASDSSGQQTIARLQSALYMPGSLPASDSIVVWLTVAMSSPDLQLLTGSYGALIASGDLRLIRSDTLRTRIVAYIAQLEHEREMLRFFRDQLAADPSRFSGPLPFLWRIFDTPADVIAADLGRQNFSFEALRSNPDLAGLLFAAQAANQNRLAHMRVLRSTTNALRLRLEDQLESGGLAAASDDEYE